MERRSTRQVAAAAAFGSCGGDDEIRVGDDPALTEAPKFFSAQTMSSSYGMGSFEEKKIETVMCVR